MTNKPTEEPTSKGFYGRFLGEAPPGLLAWFDQALARVPQRETDNWQARMQKGSPDFEAALLEILALDLAEKQGATLQEFHPDFGERAKGKRPDFLLQQGAQNLVMEVKYVSLQDEATSERWRRARQLLKGLERHVGCLDRSYYLRVFKQPSGDLKYAKLAHDLKQSMASHPGVDKHVFMNREIHFELEALGTARPGAHQIWSFGLGDEPGVFHELHLAQRMQTALENKLKRYGRLHVPMILVLGTDESFAPTEEELRTALFGQMTINFERGPNSNRSGFGRTLQGLFGLPKNHPHTRLSGILTVGCWSISRLFGSFQGTLAGTEAREPWLIWVPNPHAQYPLPDLFRNFVTWDITVNGPEEYKCRVTQGLTLGAVLNGSSV